MLKSGQSQIDGLRDGRAIFISGEFSAHPAFCSAVRTVSGVEARDRVKFYKLAWNAVGPEFASRHVQTKSCGGAAMLNSCQVEDELAAYKATAPTRKAGAA